jgi:copper chaperone NosL
MNSLALACACIATLAVSACSDRKATEATPPPHELTANAIGFYCGMNLLEHPGPKGQIMLDSRIDPVWFSSARDALSFTMLPEEPKDIRAIYVSDMGKAPNWDEPGAANWVDARKAFFVLGSRIKGGMGADETVPFSDKPAAEKFANENGGWVMTFTEVPRDYVLGAPTQTTSSVPEPASAAEVHKNGHAH